MATNQFILGIFCLAFAGGPWLSQRHLLTSGQTQDTFRNQVMHIAQQEVGVREETGNNDGPRIRSYLAAVHLKQGDPYCAAFVCWVFSRAGMSRPSSGWCPDLFPASRLTHALLSGNVLGIYSPEKKRIAHVGLILEARGDWVTSVEANTNVTGSREGDGVYRKKRNRRTIWRFADWISGKEKRP